MNTDMTQTTVYLVWDHGREIKGEAPELLSVQATEEDAIAYGKQTFETDEQADCIIECWVTGTDSSQDAFRLSDKV